MDSQSSSTAALIETLADASRGMACDATITADAFSRATRGATIPLASAGASARVTQTPLPRLSLSDPANPSSTQPGGGGSADLEILGTLGEGGMGRVLLARQRSVGREVAIKVPRDPVVGSEPLRTEALTM